MSGRLSLNGVWGLIWAEGDPLVPPHHFTGKELQGCRLLAARVPALDRITAAPSRWQARKVSQTSELPRWRTA